MTLDQFNDSLRTIVAPALKQEGFSRRKHRFYRRTEGHWGLIEFQKSVKTTAEAVTFTVNIGVVSKRLVRFFSPQDVEAVPTIGNCHWRERLGFLLPERDDTWWIADTTSSDQVVAEVLTQLVDIGIPELTKHMDDSVLKELWLSNQSPGLTNLQRLMNLSVLLKDNRSHDALQKVIEQLRQISEGKPTAPVVQNHLRKLARST